MQDHYFFTEKVKVGKKGQFTIPKKIRDEDRIKEDDVFTVTHYPSGDIILQKQKTKTPEDMMIEAIQRSPKFDWRAAWEEIKVERRRERV